MPAPWTKANDRFRPVADLGADCQLAAMSDQPTLDPLRNDAILAWLQPAADDQRLHRYLAGLEPEHRAEVEHSARSVRNALREFLSAPFPGDEDECLFVTAVHAHLVGRFPWLSDRAVEALIDHADWVY